MLILKGSNHGRARTKLQQQYAFGTMTDDLYPTTEEKVISLLDAFACNNNNNNDNNISNNNDHDAGPSSVHTWKKICTQYLNNCNPLMKTRH
jgi:hypothetical protein